MERLKRAVVLWIIWLVLLLPVFFANSKEWREKHGLKK